MFLALREIFGVSEQIWAKQDNFWFYSSKFSKNKNRLKYNTLLRAPKPIFTKLGISC
jgi:hypothetical protein